MSSLRRISLILICMLFSSASLQAATIKQTMSISTTPTDWSSSLTFARFNPALGQLLKVTITMAGNVNGDIKVENTDNGHTATITSDLQAEIVLSRPNN